MNDRIKLAEARGWTDTQQEPFGDFGRHPDNGFMRELPDPFTDANDDYAVLEHFRNDQKFEFHLCMALNDDPVRYTIGDYARAVLKVLE